MAAEARPSREGRGEERNFLARFDSSGGGGGDNGPQIARSSPISLLQGTVLELP